MQQQQRESETFGDDGMRDDVKDERESCSFARNQSRARLCVYIIVVEEKMGNIIGRGWDWVIVAPGAQGLRGRGVRLKYQFRFSLFIPVDFFFFFGGSQGDIVF